MKLPIARGVFPAGVEKDVLGDPATDEQVEDVPSRAAPTFLREAKRGQGRLPPFDEETAVFYNPTDGVVGADAIEARAPEFDRVACDGDHELFASLAHDEHVDTVLAAIDEDIGAL
jgi:hypothetical protein